MIAPRRSDFIYNKLYILGIIWVYTATYLGSILHTSYFRALISSNF